MKPLRAVAFLLAGWVTIALSLYAAFLAFRSFYLVPDDPRISLIQNWAERLEVTGVAVLVLLSLCALAYFCFAKCSQCRKR
jgi:hypothetical protein